MPTSASVALDSGPLGTGGAGAGAGAGTGAAAALLPLPAVGAAGAAGTGVVTGALDFAGQAARTHSHARRRTPIRGEPITGCEAGAVYGMRWNG